MLVILYGNGEGFEKKKIKIKIYSKIDEVWDLNEAYVNIVYEEWLMS
jgi:hypothetical protein